MQVVGSVWRRQYLDAVPRGDPHHLVDVDVAGLRDRHRLCRFTDVRDKTVELCRRAYYKQLRRAWRRNLEGVRYAARKQRERAGSCGPVLLTTVDCDLAREDVEVFLLLMEYMEGDPDLRAPPPR